MEERRDVRVRNRSRAGLAKEIDVSRSQRWPETVGWLEFDQCLWRNFREVLLAEVETTFFCCLFTQEVGHRGQRHAVNSVGFGENVFWSNGDDEVALAKASEPIKTSCSLDQGTNWRQFGYHSGEVKVGTSLDALGCYNIDGPAWTVSVALGIRYNLFAVFMQKRVPLHRTRATRQEYNICLLADLADEMFMDESGRADPVHHNSRHRRTLPRNAAGESDRFLGEHFRPAWRTPPVDQ